MTARKPPGGNEQKQAYGVISVKMAGYIFELHHVQKVMSRFYVCIFMYSRWGCLKKKVFQMGQTPKINQFKLKNNNN